jgi:putative FmdB family regulatory protein
MPIYEYVCKKCGHTLDALQKMSDDPLLDCPDCGAPQLKRLISAPRFRLKGQGWYETDFKKENQRNLSSGDGEPAKKEKGDSKSGESKPKSDSGGAKDTSAKKKSVSKDSK